MDDRHSPVPPPAGRPVRPSRRQFLRAGSLTALGVSVAGLLTASASAAPQSLPAAGPARRVASASAGGPHPQTGPVTAGSLGQAGGELVYGLTNRFDTLDPNVTTFTDVLRIAYHFCDPLVWQPQPGVFTPGLAERWEVNSSADEYTFSLRRDVKFHDGTPLDAEAVKFTFDRIVDPDLKSQVAFSAIGPYDSTTVLDSHTLRVKFKTPFAPFLDSVSQSALAPVSPTAVRAAGKDFGAKPIGTGPFKIDEYRTDNQVRLVRNPDYNWAPSIFTHQGPPLLEALTFRIIPEPATRVAALQSGEIQIMQDVPPQLYEALKADNRIGMLEGIVSGGPWMMMINVTKEPTTDVKVRQALSFGVDREGLVRAVFRGLQPVACSPLTAVTLGYDPSTCSVYPYNPERAGQLLDEAGWRMGSGGVRQKDGQDLEVRLDYRSDQATGVAIATYLQSDYAKIGVRVNLVGAAQAAYFNAVRAGEHNLQFWQSSATDPDVLRIFFYSKNADGGTNRNRYKDAEMDQLLDEAAGTTDIEKRKELYARIQKKALDEAIQIYFADPKNVFAYQRSTVKNVWIGWASIYPNFYETSVRG